MTIAYLNGDYIPLSEATISPLDRGFLFGDGIYEFMPCHQGKLIAFDWHMQRLFDNLSSIQLVLDINAEDIYQICHQLMQRNQEEGLEQNHSIYLQITRGADQQRAHLFPQNLSPTVFIYSNPVRLINTQDSSTTQPCRVVTDTDKRWQNCHIKSISLLGNLLHLNYAKQRGVDEVLLFNQKNQLTEGATSNAFIVKDKKIYTPPLDNQILPGVTRRIVIQSLAKEGINVIEKLISKEDVFNADEVWLSSSSKNIAPITHIDNQAIKEAKIGEIYQQAICFFHQHKWSF